MKLIVSEKNRNPANLIISPKNQTKQHFTLNGTGMIEDPNDPKQNPYLRQEIENHPIDTAIHSFGAGLADAPKAITQNLTKGLNAAGVISDESTQSVDDFINQEATINEGSTKGVNAIPEFLGKVATTAPLLGNPTTSIFKSGVQGANAAINGEPVENSEFFGLEKGVQAGAGFTLGALIPIVGGLLKRMFPWLAKKSKLVDETGSPTPEAERALEANGITVSELTEAAKKEMLEQAQDATKQLPGATPDQMVRINDFKQLGMTPTKGQVSRDFTQQSNEETIRTRSGEVGDGLRDHFAEQDRQLIGKTQELISNSGGKANNLDEAGTIFEQNFNANKAERKAAVDALYQEVRDKFGNVEVSPTNTLNKVNELANGIEADLVPTAGNIIRTLQTIGVVGKDGKTIAKPMTLQDMDTIRKSINSRISGAKKDKNQVRLLMQIKEAVEQDLFSSKAGNAYRPAREAFAAFANEFDNPVPVKKFFPQNSDNINETKFIERIMKAPSPKQFRDFLLDLRTKGTPEQKKRNMEMINELKRRVLENMLEAATSGHPSALEFNGKGFQTAMNKIGREKLRGLFKRAEMKQLETIERVGQHRIPRKDVGNPSGTAQRVANMLMQTGGTLSKVLPILKDFRFDLMKASFGATRPSLGVTTRIDNPAARTATSAATITELQEALDKVKF